MGDLIIDEQSNGSSASNSSAEMTTTSGSKPTIRVRDGLLSNGGNGNAGNALKRCYEPSDNILTATGSPPYKVKSSSLEKDLKVLKEEILALKWLSKRKEQEWTKMLRLLKIKEEKYLRTQRQLIHVNEGAETPAKLLAATSAGKTIQVVKANSNGSNQVFINKNAGGILVRLQGAPPKSGANQPILLLPTKQSQQSPSSGIRIIPPSSTPMIASVGSINAKSPPPGPKSSKKVPICQGCNKNSSQFVCAGCSKRWYCSRDCQVKDWDDHADNCNPEED